MYVDMSHCMQICMKLTYVDLLYLYQKKLKQRDHELLLSHKITFGQRIHKRKNHDSDTKLKRSKSNHKSITKQIRATIQKEFEQKYAEKEKLLKEMLYKLELKQKWNNENMAATNHKTLNRADTDLFLQV